ncbi:MAG: hypothetical protein Q9M18_04495 [Mariprofundaceae bacterium]|nr:hypothetical protein [Mariprofundaceae bacterium]
MRKTFECGHKGKGKRCNRCILERNQEEKNRVFREQRNNIYKTIGLNVGDIPENIAMKAYDIWNSLLNFKNADDFRKIKGWRKLTASTLKGFFVFDFGKKWRLVASYNHGLCKPVGFFSHQAYNLWLSKNVKG